MSAAYGVTTQAEGKKGALFHLLGGAGPYLSMATVRIGRARETGSPLPSQYLAGISLSSDSCAVFHYLATASAQDSSIIAVYAATCACTRGISSFSRPSVALTQAAKLARRTQNALPFIRFFPLRSLLLLCERAPFHCGLAQNAENSLLV